MVKTILFLSLFISTNALAIPGYIGDVKVISFTEKSFVVEQAGYRLNVDADKLPHDLIPVWKKNVGKVIVSAVPYVAVTKETKIANFQPPKQTDR
jgi:hypothetical protein